MIGSTERPSIFSESPSALVLVGGATNPGSLGRNSNPSLTIQPTATLATLSGHCWTLWNSDEEEVSAKRVVTKVGRGAVKPVRHSLHRTPTRPSRPAG